MEYLDPPNEDRGPLPKDYTECLLKAKEIFESGKHVL